MLSQKIVIPAKAGIQWFCNGLKFLDSRLRGNDGNEGFSAFCEFIKLEHEEPASLIGRRKFRLRDAEAITLEKDAIDNRAAGNYNFRT